MFFEAAPAKVNLALHVVGRRADRYHELQSLVVFADIFDELEAEAAPVDTLAVSGPFATGLGSGETNLVVRAVAAFRARWPGRAARSLAIRLRKNLPVAAGLGGGSADAAAALRLLAGLASPRLPRPTCWRSGPSLAPMCRCASCRGQALSGASASA